MRLALASAVALTLVAAHPARASSESDVQAAATLAGVDETDLAGAVNSTGLSPKDYLMAVGEIPRPATKPSGRLQCIARVESHNDPNATNRWSGAAGLYQFLPSTWMTTPQGRAGRSPYDPEAATEAAQWMIDVGRIREWDAVRFYGC